jgi:hypothetical protein
VTLDATVRLQLGSLDLDVQVVAADGETVAVLGPERRGEEHVPRARRGPRTTAEVES